MKKILSLLLATTLVLSFSGCGKQEKVDTTPILSTVEHPYIEIGSSIELDDLASIQLMSANAIPQSNKILVSFSIANTSEKDIDISFWNGIEDVYVGNPENYATDGCFQLYKKEIRRDYINNDKQEESGKLRSGAKMMIMFQFDFVRYDAKFYDDFGDFLTRVKNMTIEMTPFYSTDSHKEKKNYTFEIDFEKIYEVFEEAQKNK